MSNEGMKMELELRVSDLDGELVRLPVRFFTASEEWAQARYDLDEKKRALDSVIAELDDEARRNLEKVTEGAVQTYIKNHADYDKAVAAVNKAKFEAAKKESAVESLKLKGKSLDNLSRLYVANYFTDSSVRTGGERKKWDADDMDDKAGGQRAALKNRKRK